MTMEENIQFIRILSISHTRNKNMAHVFIVNNITFKYHLEYLFAGTGASDVSTDFIFDATIKLNSQDEKRSVGMICDVSRIKKGDKILFFVTKIARFYGVFEADSEFFLDPNDNNNYLKSELGKILTYRIRIKPYKVFENGVSEYDCLDSLKGISYPDQICWSLIYRKLGGNRGCTMITEQEYEALFSKLKTNNKELCAKYYSFNLETNQIIPASKNNYLGRMIDIESNMIANMHQRILDKKAFEHYLQYFVVLELKKNNGRSFLSEHKPVTWIGNEVMCSFGEHRIDCLSIQESEKDVVISLIELKDEKINEWIKYQLESYLVWLEDYITPYYLRLGKSVKVYPIIISDGIYNARQSTRQKLQDVEASVKNTKWNKYETRDIKICDTKIYHFEDYEGEIKIKGD